ncbi:MAG TPA: acetyltransferase [Salinimicrobium sp.]|nr:acetyltransferase [Salinimicrobium sp.]
MEPTKIALLGASGHAKVLIRIIESLPNCEVATVYDDNASIKKIMDFPVTLGLPKILPEDQKGLIGVGRNKSRAAIASERSEMIFAEAVVHPDATVCPTADLGEGTVVMPRAVINTEAIIGKHCIVNSGAVVEHEAVLEDFVHISPNAVITGNVFVGEGTEVGAGASVIPGIKIGKWAVIGAGSVIIKDVPDFATVVGNPGKII